MKVYEVSCSGDSEYFLSKEKADIRCAELDKKEEEEYEADWHRKYPPTVYEIDVVE